MKSKIFLAVLGLTFAQTTFAQVQNFNTKVRFKSVDEDLKSDKVAILDETGMLKYILKDSLVTKVDDSNFLKKDESNSVTENFSITDQISGSTLKINEEGIVSENMGKTLSLNTEDDQILQWKSGDNRLYLQNTSISGIYNNNNWSISAKFKTTDSDKKSFLNLPFTGEGINSKTLTISVNGLLADENGNINLPTTDESKFLKKNETNLVENNFDINNGINSLKLENESLTLKNIGDPGNYVNINYGNIDSRNPNGYYQLSYDGIAGSGGDKSYQLTPDSFYMGDSDNNISIVNQGIISYKTGIDKTGSIELPNTGEGTVRTITTSVNGNYADKNGNVNLVIPQPDLSNYVTKDEFDINIPQSVAILNENKLILYWFANIDASKRYLKIFIDGVQIPYNTLPNGNLTWRTESVVGNIETIIFDSSLFSPGMEVIYKQEYGLAIPNN